MKDKEYHVANFATFVSKTLTFSPQEMDEFSDRLSTASIKCLNWPSPVFGRFQNGCNKVVIEPRVVQFWSEIILVISNHAYVTIQHFVFSHTVRSLKKVHTYPDLNRSNAAELTECHLGPLTQTSLFIRVVFTLPSLLPCTSCKTSPIALSNGQ